MRTIGAQLRRFVFSGLLLGLAVPRLWSSAVAVAANLETPDWAVLRLKTTPDLQQKDLRLRYDLYNPVLCGPVAASNGLAFLATHGFPGLLPLQNNGLDPQVALVKRLESARYLAITEKGSNTTDMLRGLSNYIADCGYHCTRLEYQGNHSPAQPWNLFKTGDFPKLESLQRALDDPTSLVLLEIAWYREDSDDETALHRLGGHWVLAVGASVDGDGREIFYIRNPEKPGPPAGEPWTGISLRPTAATWLINSPRHWTKAAGYEEVKGAALPHRSNHSALLTGLVILKIGA